MSPGPLIEARELRVTREGRSILDGASLCVGPGEIVAVEGASGSGKSTLIRAMATLLEPDSGQVFLRGVEAHAISPTQYRTRVAYLPQQPAMFPGTVADNVAFGPGLRGVQLPHAQLLTLLALAELPADCAGREANTLSGGERQRVALARALANAPEVLLLDEPTASLDPKTGLQIVNVIRTLAQDGRAIVMVTHLPAHAEVLGGRRCVCEAGRVRPR